MIEKCFLAAITFRSQKDARVEKGNNKENSQSHLINITLGTSLTKWISSIQHNK